MDTETLIHKHLTGVANDSERAALRAALKQDPTLANDIFNEAVFAEDVRALHERNVASVSCATKIPAFYRTTAFKLAAAATIMLAVGLGVLLSLTRTPVEDGVIVAHMTGVQFSGTETCRVHTVISNREIILKQGRIRLEIIHDGQVASRLAVEGPATFRMVSPRELWLKNGLLTADILAPDHTLAVVTPKLKICDIGTKFGVVVGTDSMVDTHVFQGKVELSPTEQSSGLSGKFTIEANQSGRLVNDGKKDKVVVEKAEGQYFGFNGTHFANETKGYLSLNPELDLTVRSDGKSFVNQNLECGGESDDLQSRTFIKFDLSSIPRPPAEINSARLRLMLVQTDLYGGTRVGPATTQWNYSNRPSFDLRGNGFQAAGWMAGSARQARDDTPWTPPQVGIYYQADVTSIVREWLAHPESNHGFVLLEPRDEAGHAFTRDRRVFGASRSANPPQLVIEWDEQ